MTGADFTSAEREMLRYVRPLVVHAVLIKHFRFRQVILVVVLLLALHNGITPSFFFVLSLMGIYLGIGALILFLDIDHTLHFLKSNNIYNEAVFDFSESRAFLYNNIRLGNNYLFGRNYCTILRYSDICRIYQKSFGFKAGFMNIEDGRILYAVDKYENVWSICEFDTQGFRKEICEQELMSILGFMLSKNPQIYLSYC